MAGHGRRKSDAFKRARMGKKMGKYKMENL